MIKTLALASTLALAACGSDSTPKKIDAAGGSDAPSGASLTVKNAPTATPWCSITIGSGTAFTTASMSVPITATGPITLKASPQPGFKLDTGMWHHTTGDTGTGDSGTVAGTTSTTTVMVTMGTAKCVWVCCPGSTGTPVCPTTDQCP
jgi:hypothetical protein